MKYLKHIHWFLFLVCLMMVPFATHAEYDSAICKGTVCTESEVGPFMKDITKACGNLGNCTLADMMMVVGNVGNFVAGVVGGVVLLMYVMGGMYYLTSGGKQEGVTKGKKYLTGSTYGLLIVLIAYVGINFLKSTFGVTINNTGVYVKCNSTSSTEGQSCEKEKMCSGGKCLDLCTIEYGGARQCTSGDDPDGKCDTNKCGVEGALCCPK